MSKFTDTVRQDTPRLVVMYRSEAGKDVFQWGVLGEIPILTLIGRITRIQLQLSSDAWIDECDHMALVVAWDAAQREFSVFVHRDIPEDPLVGMLETVKHAIVSTQAAMKKANQQMILGPDGQPARRGGM